VRPQLDRMMKSGAGLLADQELRSLFREYNDRLLRHGPESMPSSFTVAQRFFRLNADRVLELLPESDHAFSFADFLDFVTSADAPSDPLSHAERFDDGRIYSYTCTDDPRDLRFSVGDDKECGVAGVSMVRTQDELTVFLIGGAPANQTQIESRPLNAGSSKFVSAPGREWLDGAMKKVADEVTWKLPGFDDLQRVLAFARFGLKSRAIQVRLVAVDMGSTFNVHTDDPSVFEQFSDSDVREALEASNASLEKYAVLFECCNLLTLLPAYFAFKIRLVRDRVRATQVASKWERQRAEQARDEKAGVSPPAADGVRFKRVASLEIVSSVARPVARRFTAPRFQVEVDGFWRALPSGRIGTDQQGNPVHGRTWVRSHTRWTQRPKQQATVLVKSRLSIARAVVASERLASDVQFAPSDGDQSKVVIADESVSREAAFEERRKLTSVVRWSILQRDDFRCQACGADAASDRNVRLDVDHVLPIAKGGKTDPANLRTLCARCNNGKGESLIQ
ncbi:MAG TPA: HNH endonuclease signature motif containing protein, partial [Phycisphaerales bacterium]|nr:HNH endonuclease signature motif containing protein [Phycisphaerales bacterium]